MTKNNLSGKPNHRPEAYRRASPNARLLIEIKHLRPDPGLIVFGNNTREGFRNFDILENDVMARIKNAAPYYFDMKDGKARRDRSGLEFQTVAGAIDHSKELAQRLRSDPRLTDRALSIVVLDQDGREVHREPVHPSD